MMTLDNLAAARAKLAALEARSEAYSGNNPDKYRSPISDARAEVHRIEVSLKASGALPRSEHEQLEAALDAAFPNARSKDIVDFNGKQYQRRFSPVSKSLSGKAVKEWAKSWVAVADKD